MRTEAHAWIGLLRRLAPLLPSDLFDQLRAFPDPDTLIFEGGAAAGETGQAFARHLRQVIVALNSLRHTLTTFLPRYLLDLNPTPGDPSGELLEGSFIFADVTGFTALTGELSKRGTAGREEMNRLMRDLFAAILDPLLTSGGDLLFFAGDAVLATFPAQPDGLDAQWATRTALRMVRAIGRFAHLETAYGTFSLTMSAGVARGKAFAAVVGNRSRMELLISGGPVQGAMQAEGEGEPGQVVADAATRALLPPDEFALQGHVVLGLQSGDLDDYEAVPPTRRRPRLSASFSQRIPDLVDQLRQSLDQVEALSPFFPPDLFVQIARGEDIRQHPPVAIQFVNLMGLEEMAYGPPGPHQAAAVLHRYFVQAQDIVSSREGIIGQVDPYVQGFTLLNPFGALKQHEGVPSLAASAALELNTLLNQINREFKLDPPLTQRLGLTYDRIFTGEIGYLHRREYVVAGPAVNLAARLMSKAAPGQTVLDPVIWKEVEDDFVADTLPAIPLKGIPKPVPRFDLRGLRKGRGYYLSESPLLVHRQERRDLEAYMDAAIEGRGQALALLGETGFGKSRIVTALIKTARKRRMTVLSGRCRTFAQTTPYLPWAELVGEWFGLEEDQPAETRRHHLRDQLARFDLTASLPAFADLLGLPPVVQKLSAPLASTPSPTDGVFARLQQEQKKDVASLAALLNRRVAEATTAPAQHGPSMWDVLRERTSIPHALELLLERQTLQKPTMVIIEDIQWIDPESQHILRAVAEASAEWPLFLLATARPGVEWWGQEYVIPPLSDEESRELAAGALRADALEPDLAAWLLERVGGNPLFIFSYCRALQDANAVVIDPVSGAARWSGPPPPLPRTLQQLMLAQVGRLTPDTQGALQRGAVVGDPFAGEFVAHLYADGYAAGHLETWLGQATRRSLIAPPPPAPVYRFSSQSLHDAIYETLSHAQRGQWHEQIGDHLLHVDAQSQYERLEQVAYHYRRSESALKAARFTRLAGDKARTRQADEAALAFYLQSLDVDADDADVAFERRQAHEGIGDVYALQGRPAEAHSAYHAALPDAPPQDALRLHAKLALLGPLLDPDADALTAAREKRTGDGTLNGWVDAAQVWVSSGRGDVAGAAALCRDVLPAAPESVAQLLREALDTLEQAEPLSPYAEFFSLFACSYLRYPPGGGL
ncbi:MAG: AAA family ATPase [Anaerolineae bacterium]|nr:AAA family ATPase [Anaerolineae bacterium]